VRQFNETFKEVYGCPPSTLRRHDNGAVDGTICLKLVYRPPLDAKALFDFLGARAIAGIESYQDGVYQRTLRLPHGGATVALAAADGHISAQLNLSDVRDLTPAVARCRRLLDLDADPQAIDGAIPGSSGTRLPRAVDGFEMAVRAVVGQQISVSGARTVLAKLVRDGQFPTPDELLDLPNEAFAMPTRRRETLRALANAMTSASGALTLDSGSDRQTTRAALLELPGIGEWTAGYISMRALGDPDVFLPTDLGTLRGAAALGLPTDPKELAKHAERWRPWRSYAQILLWRAN
jgi:AraC family transcriptional regulator, regulatory protein of adaptative response / DNA-3-methyladenine glycosylase II